MVSSSEATEFVSSADANAFPEASYSPAACSSFMSSFSMTSLPATAGKQKEVDETFLVGEDLDYIRDHCLVPSENLKTFSDVIGNPQLAAFADQYQPKVPLKSNSNLHPIARSFFRLPPLKRSSFYLLCTRRRCLDVADLGSRARLVRRQYVISFFAAAAAPMRSVWDYRD